MSPSLHSLGQTSLILYTAYVGSVSYNTPPTLDMSHVMHNLCQTCLILYTTQARYVSYYTQPRLDMIHSIQSLGLECFSYYKQTRLDMSHIIHNVDQTSLLSHDLARYCQVIVPWDIVVQIPTMKGYVICCHEHFVIVSDVNNGVMTTAAANNGHDYVTELPVTSQWFGML